MKPNCFNMFRLSPINFRLKQDITRLLFRQPRFSGYITHKKYSKDTILLKKEN